MAHDKADSHASNAPPSSDYEQKPGYTWKTGALAIADFGLIVASTSVLITVVQSPLKSIAMNLTKYGRFSDHDKPWSYPAIAALYRGSVAALTGGVARSTYVVGSKSVATKEAQLELEIVSSKNVATKEAQLELDAHENNALVGKKNGLLSRLPNVALVTTGDTLVTQISETKAQLTKAGISQNLYKWNSMPNFVTLAKLGVVSRFSGSMINFTALCITTDFYAKYIPGDNKNIKQSVGGMLSGLTAAVISFPFSYYSDYLITKVAQSEGKLIAPKASQVIYDAFQNVKKMDKIELVQNAKIVAANAGVRALTTGVTFAIVAGVSSFLGSDPVTRLFNESHEDASPTQNHKKQLNEMKAEQKTEKMSEESDSNTKSSKP